MSPKVKKRIRNSIISVVIVLALVIPTCIYFGTSYAPEESALECLNGPNVKVSKDQIAFIPTHTVAGFIFYPGAKVEFEAYAPIMAMLAEEGILCVIVRVPFNFAFFNTNAADGIQEEYPFVENWYIGGHSLGGVVASSYLSKHVDSFQGEILFASYPSVNLSNTQLSCLSITASNDQVLNQKSYEKAKANMPQDYQEVCIDGGCHAFFGAYGAQKGDGIPTITPQEQYEQVVKAILNFIPY